MSEHVEIPHLKSIRDLLGDLTGRDVEVAAGEPVAVGGLPGSVVGLFVDDELSSRAVVVLDLALAASTGAALGLVPPSGAQAAVEDGELPENLFDNCREVLNIMATLFDVPGSPHLRLYAAYRPTEVLRVDVREIAVRRDRRLDVAVDVARYGPGAMSVVIV